MYQEVWEGIASAYEECIGGYWANLETEELVEWELNLWLSALQLV